MRANEKYEPQHLDGQTSQHEDRLRRSSRQKCRRGQNDNPACD